VTAQIDFEIGHRMGDALVPLGIAERPVHEQAQLFRPGLETLSVLDRDTEHPGDDLSGQWCTEFREQIDMRGALRQPLQHFFG
jgi:hypothetical protein